MLFVTDYYSLNSCSRFENIFTLVIAGKAYIYTGLMMNVH